MLLKDILAAKGKHVFRVDVRARLADVVQELVKHNIGSLIVCDGESMVGIVTERDILRTVAESGANLAEICVRDRMSVNVVSASPEDEVSSVMGVMTDRRIRHLPVLEQGKLVGMVSIGDLVKAQHDVVTMENQQLLQYIQS